MSFAGMLYDLSDFQGGVLVDIRREAVLYISFHCGVLINICRGAVQSI